MLTTDPWRILWLNFEGHGFFSVLRAGP